MNYYDGIFKKTLHRTSLDHTRPTVVYGAGKTGRIVADVLQKQGIQVVAYLDKNPLLKNLDGIPVLPVEGNELDATILQVVVAVFNFKKESGFQNIQKVLRNAGFDTIVSFESFYQIFCEFMPESIFWLTGRSFYEPFKNEIESADSLWTDEKSRCLYRALIEHRLTASFDTLPESDASETQYLPLDVPLPKPPYRLIDVGAFDGDTIELFLRNKIPLIRIIAFEPDQKNFKKLVHHVNECKSSIDITLLPLGVGRASTIANISTDGSSSACCLSDGKNRVNLDHVQIVALSDILHGIEPTYIKMDIEGFEEEALWGLRQFLEQHRPTLAISVYHRPQDLFALPLLLSSWNYPANFYLRMYCEHTFETVLYAVPIQSANA